MAKPKRTKAAPTAPSSEGTGHDVYLVDVNTGEVTAESSLELGALAELVRQAFPALERNYQDDPRKVAAVRLVRALLERCTE